MSTAATSVNSYLLKNLPLPTQNRSYSSARSTCAARISTAKHGYCNSSRQHIQSFSINRGVKANRIFSMDLNSVNNLPQAPPIPSGGSPFPGWSNWWLLSIIPVIIPFLTNKWGPLIALKEKFDATLQTVSNITETIEDVAEGVDKFADEVSERLPEGSRLKKIVERIDDIAEETVKAADRAEELYKKVEDAQDQLEMTIQQSIKDRQSLKNQLEDAKAKKVVEEK